MQQLLKKTLQNRAQIVKRLRLEQIITL